MERYTYEIAFTRLDGQLDGAQQFTDEAYARELLRIFDDPDCAEFYSRIQLTAMTGKPVQMKFWKP